MATYTLIESQVLGSAAASVTFSSIPATYTDLKIVMSARTDSIGQVADNLELTLNGSTASFSSKIIYGNGSVAASSTADRNAGLTTGAGATANTYGSAEVYFPNYASNNYKSYSQDSVNENNATTAYTYLVAGLWSNTAAITTITLTPGSASNIVADSSFNLYGISNTI
jgi:hypothetical protein